MKTLFAMLLAMAVPAVWAEASSGDDLEELQMQQDLAEKSKALLQEYDTAIQKFTGAEGEALANDPELQQALEEDKAAFEQQQKAVENELEQ